MAGLSIGLVLGILGLVLGSSFLARAQEGGAATGGAAGPLVVVTLEKGEKIRGALLEYRDGRVRIKPEGEALERTLQSSDVVALDFAPEEPVVAQAKPAGNAAAPKVASQPDPQPKTNPEPVAAPKNSTTEGPQVNPEAHSKDEPKRSPEPSSKRRPVLGEFRKKWMEARLTPEERTRFHELMPREPNLTPAERKEMDALRQKVGLLDPEASRRLVGEVMDEARQAQRKGTLAEYSDNHMKRLRTAMTEEERRRHIASLFAAARVAGPDGVPPFKDITVNLMRSANANPALFEDQMKDLRARYELFCDEVERLEAPQPPRPR